MAARVCGSEARRQGLLRRKEWQLDTPPRTSNTTRPDRPPTLTTLNASPVQSEGQNEKRNKNLRNDLDLLKSLDHLRSRLSRAGTGAWPAIRGRSKLAKAVARILDNRTSERCMRGCTG